jgi:Tfp pilus assembly protein PilZ
MAYSRHLSGLISSLRRLNLLRTDRRWCPRKSRFVYVDYVVRGRSYNDAISNISRGGACLRTQRPFRPGDEIALDLSRLGLRTHVGGRIVWTCPRSIGIEFRSVSAEAKGVGYEFNARRDNVTGTEKKTLGMGKIRKRMVRWEPSDDAEKYRLYWPWKGPI